MASRVGVLWMSVMALACGHEPPGSHARPAPPSATDTADTTSTSSAAWFIDAAPAADLAFVHVNGATGHYHYPELLPPGVALVDYDRDDDLDIFVTQGHVLDAPAPDTPVGRLFRNDLQVAPDGDRRLRFTDVTSEHALPSSLYGLGVATGDVDNDGWMDLLVTTYGRARLLRNRAGRLVDATETSGLTAAPGFGVSAAFVDYDRDGWLDLYVGHNVDYRLDSGIECGTLASARDYCPPETYGGTPDRLYRNTGDGRFTDVSDEALVDGRFGPALGVATADFDDDGWTDIYVANDGTENLLWLNQQDGTFRDVGLLSAVALSELGLAEASMGVDAGDVDDDGDEDLIMTHLTREGHNLSLNDGTGRFTDHSAPSGLGPASLPDTGWGTAFVDVDNDGWLDVLAVNGTITARRDGPPRPFPYDQPKRLLRNDGHGRFEDVTDQGGAALRRSTSGRGAAFGDVDNDGDIDVVVGNDAGPLELLVNQIGTRHHWLGLRLVDGTGRDALGARVSVEAPDTPTRWRRARTDGSYASAHDPRVLVGLGDSDAPRTVRVLWPSGHRERFDGLAADRWLVLQEGHGSTSGAP